MSTTSAIAHYPVSMPATASAPATIGASGKTDGDADQGVEVGGSGSGVQGVNSHLSHAVQQALGHLHAEAKITPADASGQVLPMTMQGFIQALIASLHQIGTGHAVASQSPAQSASLRAVSAGNRYAAPAATNDVQNLMRQAATVLSSNTALQQDFQSMLRAAGIDQSATSLQHFLRSVSSQMKPSSVVDAIA